MNRRTKWLAIGAAIVFGLYFVDRTYRSWVEEPTTRLTSEVDRLTAELQSTNDAQTVAQRTNRRLDSYSQRALPADPQLARSAYQQWLIQLLHRHGVKSASIDAGQPRPMENRSRLNRRKRIPVGHRISYTLRGQATLAQWSDLLAEFHQAGHLHKIGSLSFNPLGTEGLLDANLTIEVLGMVSSPRKDTLTQWKLASTPSETTQGQYGALVRRNLFARGFSKELYEIELKAITFNKLGQAEAWFKTDGQGTMHTLQVHQNLPVALHAVSIEEVLRDRVLVKLSGEPIWISLGQSLGEACQTHQEQ